MSAPPSGRGEPITHRRQLVEWFERGCKPKSAFRIGTEHEKFAFTVHDLRPLPYEGRASIRALLEGLAERFGWQPIHEDGRPIALVKNGCSVTLEPGGQLELSGAPLETLHQTCCEVHTHLDEVKKVAEPLGIGMLGMGFNPKWRREDIPWMPKGRYRIMRAYMPKKGSLGLDMMLRTCTVQVNLDFESESDMVRKMRVGLALQPVATALFANSPFLEGKPSGYLSLRSKVWLDTDPDRTGMLPFVFEEGFGFERYVDYLLDVPMYFVYRDGRYIDAAGQSFRDFLEGRLPALPGERPTLADWADHVTTAFPEVRLKRYIEMRGADGGRFRTICAVPAFWVGLLYDETSLRAAWDLVSDWTAEERQLLRERVPELGLSVPFRDGTLLDVARTVVGLAREGLARRARLNWDGRDETCYLAPIEETVATGLTPAEVKLRRYDEEWGRSVDPLFTEFAF
ncbi:MAG: glutamate--cysteine ligase [Geminicoccaceae bacterium]|nr:glutamate--cysteine ligase [Geminicoccaceae bacterium]MCX7629549.1 glutamate--cysteine ligase [Geminicoccaceae bacterium]MDW8125542.1 glutamate--cysteine ligase [Geminicoccaceae bacterium]